MEQPSGYGSEAELDIIPNDRTGNNRTETVKPDNRPIFIIPIIIVAPNTANLTGWTTTGKIEQEQNKIIYQVSESILKSLQSILPLTLTIDSENWLKAASNETKIVAILVGSKDTK